MLLLTGCQTLDSVQYIVPATREPELAVGLTDIATAHGMAVRTQRSVIPGTIVYFQLGDRTFTDLGARRHDGEIIVDLQFRAAGLGGKEYRKMKPEVANLLHNLYGDQVETIEDWNDQVPIMKPEQNKALHGTAGGRADASPDSP